MTKKVATNNLKAKATTADSGAGTEEQRKRFTIDIPVSLHKKLKLAAVNRDQTMADMICNMIEEFLKK